MPLDTITIYTFFLVFVRCSGMMLAAPVFGAANLPTHIRVFITMALSMALTFSVRPTVGQVPQDLVSFGLAIGNEAISGLLIGAFFSLVMHAVSMAGAIVDLQMGLGMSQVLNPVTGVPVSVIGQFKYLLGLIVFLQIDAHHLMLGAFLQSYSNLPTLSTAMLEPMRDSLVTMLTSMTLLAIQMAAPVAAVSIVVDAALGLVNRAVPQMQVFLVGMPAKTVMGMIALSISIPALVGTVQSGVDMAATGLTAAFGGAR